MRLQSTTSLENPDWQCIVGSETTNQVTLPVGVNNGFFRLAEP